MSFDILIHFVILDYRHNSGRVITTTQAPWVPSSDSLLRTKGEIERARGRDIVSVWISKYSSYKISDYFFSGLLE